MKKYEKPEGIKHYEEMRERLSSSNEYDEPNKEEEIEDEEEMEDEEDDN